MLALALQDIVRLLMRCGAGAQVVQSPDLLFPSMLTNGVVLQWLVCGALVLLQVGLGWLAARFYQQPELFSLLMVSAPVLLLYPIVCARVFVITRNNDLKMISIYTAISLSAENATVALSALLGADIYAIVYGKYAFALTWTGCFVRHASPELSAPMSFNRLWCMVRRSAKLTLSESAKAVRIHLDLLVVGRLLSPELVGIYSFARNISLGINQSITHAFEAALFPYFCSSIRQDQLYVCCIYLIDCDSSRSPTLFSAITIW